MQQQVYGQLSFFNIGMTSISSTKKIKVLRIINRFNLGGPTYNVAYLSKYLPEEYETKLIGGLKEDSENSSLFILDNLGIKPEIIEEMRRDVNLWRDLNAFFRIRKIIKSYKPDIVHTHASKAGTIGRLAAYTCGVKVIVHTFHGHVFHSYFGWLKTYFYKTVERFLASKSTRIVAISKKQKEELSQQFSICKADKISVIPLGFDLKRFTENIDEKRKAFRTEYYIENDVIAIGIVGRLVPVKNHKLFIDAIRYVKQHSRKKVRAFIIGDGEMLNPIKNYILDLEMDYCFYETRKYQSTFCFTSWIKEVDVCYAGVDIVALSSLNEGTPVSLIEAQAANKPIVSTNVGGIENVVMKNQTALLSEINNPMEFYTNLLRLVEDDNLRTTMSTSAKQSVMSKFTYQSLAENMANLYTNLLSK
jgi:glycosyltransferase involved in cell wall biosynthesis